MNTDVPELDSDDKPGGNTQTAGLKRKRKEWHEREIPVKVVGEATKKGVRIEVKSAELTTSLELKYPNEIWSKYPKQNKVKLVDNITYIFTAHLPFLLKGNIRLEYNTGYPQAYSWANQCFMRFLPAYWYLYRGRRGTSVFPLLKTMLNSRAVFSEAKDVPPTFPETLQKNVLIPFTFGKESFLSYCIATDLGLNPTLVYFNEPTEVFSRQHKIDLIKRFSKMENVSIYFMDNPLGSLREYGEGWFGWELALTSWSLLSLPFAYKHRAAYLIFGNEKSNNDFFYDEEKLKVVPDYEQSSQATEELSLLTQSLSEGEFYTTSFVQGVNELTIIAILKQRYFDRTFTYLMSCWAETEAAKNKRWCAHCSKCARLYIYMTANGIDPIEDAGYQDNMLTEDKIGLFNVFGEHASGTGWDAFGLNTNEQALAFYLTYLRGNRDPLVVRFSQTKLFTEIRNNLDQFLDEYYSYHHEQSMPPQWRDKINGIFEKTLRKARKEIMALVNN